MVSLRYLGLALLLFIEGVFLGYLLSIRNINVFGNLQQFLSNIPIKWGPFGIFVGMTASTLLIVVILIVLSFAFWLWMLIDALLRRKIAWVIIIFFLHLLGAVLYYILEKRKYEEKIVREKTEYKIRPKIDISEAIRIMKNHLKSFYVRILSIGSSRFKEDKGVWEFIVDTDKGYYLVEVNNDGKIVRSDKLSQKEFQRRLKLEYKIEE
jgi:hypothetical protein